MFWIGMLVGLVIGCVGIVVVCFKFTLKFTGLNYDEFSEVVLGLEDVGNHRDSEIHILTNVLEESEEHNIIEFKKG